MRDAHAAASLGLRSNSWPTSSRRAYGSARPRQDEMRFALQTMTARRHAQANKKDDEIRSLRDELRAVNERLDAAVMLLAAATERGVQPAPIETSILNAVSPPDYEAIPLSAEDFSAMISGDEY